MRLLLLPAARALALAVCLTPLAAQQPAQPILAPAVALAPPSLCADFDVIAATVQQLAVPAVAPSGEFQVDVVFGGAVCTLVLQPHELRAPGYRLLAVDQQGTQALPWTPCTTFRGFVAGDAGSIAAATCDAGSLRALVRLGDGSTWAVQPVRAVDPAAGAAAHVVFREADCAPLPYRCGVTATGAPGGAGGPDGTFTCELACEADYPYYQRNNSSTTATQNDILGIVNATEAIYQTDLLIHYTVTTVLVRTSTDPYTSSTPDALLREFTSEWNRNQVAIARDVAQLYTNRNISSGGVIGIATLATICQLQGAYSVVRSRFTSNLTQRVGLSAHELGHNWGANHCDGSSDCRIMCSGLGGCSNILTSFSPGEVAQITPLRNSAVCLSVQAVQPQLAGVSPPGVGGLQPAPVTLTGSGFIGTTRIDVGPAALLTGAFALIDDQTLRFDPPPGLPPGPQAVTVTNAAGTSNAGTLAYAAISPPEFTAPVGAIGGLWLVFEFGGLPVHVWILVLDLGAATNIVQGWPLLANPAILAIGTLSPGGLGGFSVQVPPGVLNGFTLHSQLLDVDPATVGLAGTSPVRATQFFF